MSLDPNRPILTGENPLIRLSDADGGAITIPALGARLTVNGVQAKGRPFPTQREGRPFSTCALAFSESWTEAR
jgi:hypothetical protein